MKKVLHIAEYDSTGIHIALENYLHSTQNLPIEHYLFAKTNKENTLKISDSFKEVKIINTHFFSVFFNLLKYIKEINPEIIHLHSSLAGLMARFISTENNKIIYTPHCFSFERQNISAQMKMLLISFEKYKLNNVDIVAASSEREKALACSLGAKQSMLLNNYANISSSIYSAPASIPPINIFIVGNLNEQKDPIFLIKTMQLLKKYQEYKKLNFFWLGEGEQKFIRLLKRNKVNVSGWLSREKLISAMQKAHLYLHTSAWDGMSLTLLEAAKLHIPTIIRFTPSLQGIPYPFIAQSPKAMAQQIIDFLKAPYHPDYLTSLNIFNHHFTLEKQRSVLKTLYEVN